LSAWNPATGQVENSDAQVKAIKIIITGMDQNQSGVPALPMNEGKTHYGSSVSDMWGYDVVLNNGVLYVIGELNRELSLKNLVERINQTVATASVLLYASSSRIVTETAGVSRAGRIYLQTGGLYPEFAHLYNRFLFQNNPIQVSIIQ
jgi:hypothetical protein